MDHPWFLYQHLRLPDAVFRSKTRPRRQIQELAPTSGVFLGPLQPLSRRLRTVAIAGGLLLLGFDAFFLAQAIEAYVWEGVFRPAFICWVYLPVYLGLAILVMVIRDYRLVYYGTTTRHSQRNRSSRSVAPLEKRNWRAAIKCFREAAPEARSAEAREYVIRLFHSSRVQTPGKLELHKEVDRARRPRERLSLKPDGVHDAGDV